MRFFIIISFAIYSWAHVLTVHVPAPDFNISDDTLVVEDAAYINAPGTPNVPGKTVTIALPPGAIVEGVNFAGTKMEIGSCEISPTLSPLPLTDDANLLKEIQESYELKKNKYYRSDNIFPQDFGAVLSKGGLRKYTLVTVICYHFAYRPMSKRLYYSPNISVEIRYRMPNPGSERAQFWQQLKDDITYDEIAQEVIYNWQNAQTWYKTDSPKRANGYYIIIPASLQNTVDSLVAYRQMQGYDVNVVTKEYIESNIPGIDLQQKIRNYLRQNLPDIEYTLLVGFISDIPWRNLVPFNNDPDSPYDDPNISPIPSDLYYAELTDHDTLSWNSDRDEYYGEVYDSLTQPNGEDNPDYHADIHLGRIPYSTDYVIEDICAKMISFDSNTDILYKTASLLPAAMYYFENENNGGSFRLDGASFTEELFNDGILDSTNAVTLYEQAGLRPSIFSCTDSLTRDNHIMYWQNKGIMYECHHGSYDCYARKIWAWDDGDSIPENNEMSWPLSLHRNDVFLLDNDHPATTFLRSCLCGKPEVYCLGGHLLYRGSSAVISSSRIAWLSLADMDGIPYHFFKRLMQDTTLSSGIIGNAYDIARNDFMGISGFWIIIYHYNLFGDPALRQFGRAIGTEELKEKTIVASFGIFPNPNSGQLTINLSCTQKRKIRLDAYDVSGRFVESLYTGYVEGGSKNLNTKLPAGVYFFRLVNGNLTTFEKVIIIK